MDCKRILMLGAGFVAKPALEVLIRKDFNVTVAGVDVKACEDLCQGLRNARPLYIDVLEEAGLDRAVAQNEIIVSLIPFAYHTYVIKSAIRNQKNVITTSYVSPAMAELHKAAEDAGIVVLNECGLDPGIDHLLALQTIKAVHREGGRIKSLRSYCGALPAPENANNPLGYNFSWSPRGVLLALKNPATFYENQKVKEVAGLELMAHARSFQLNGSLDLVAYPNRNATIYRDRYRIPEAETVVRSTLRYAGFPTIVKALADIGFLTDQNTACLDPSKPPLPWREVTRLTVNALSSEESDLTEAVLEKTESKNKGSDCQIIDALKWIGLFSNNLAKPCGTPLDTLCARLEELLVYQPGERDMVVLQHQFEIDHADGQSESRKVSLTEFGQPEGHSALARLVGLTCAVAVEKVLDGSIHGKGMATPTDWSSVEILLEELETYGIRASLERSFVARERFAEFAAKHRETAETGGHEGIAL